MNLKQLGKTLIAMGLAGAIQGAGQYATNAGQQITFKGIALGGLVGAILYLARSPIAQCKPEAAPVETKPPAK